MPHVWDKDVQNRKKLIPDNDSIGVQHKAGYFHHWDIQLFLFPIGHYGLMFTLPDALAEEVIALSFEPSSFRYV